jgi:hypothetical protein
VATAQSDARLKAGSRSGQAQNRAVSVEVLDNLEAENTLTPVHYTAIRYAATLAAVTTSASHLWNGRQAARRLDRARLRLRHRSRAPRPASDRSYVRVRDKLRVSHNCPTSAYHLL